MNNWRGWGSKNDFECPPLIGLRHPASASCLGRHSRLAGRCPNNSSLFPPLAAVVVVASHIQRKEYFLICSSGKSADFPELPFHGWGRKGRWHICRLPRIPLCESWIQKRPQAFLNPKFKMKFLNLWPKRTRRPFQIVPQGLAHRGSSLTKQKSGRAGGQAARPVFVFFASAVVPNTAGAAPEAAEQTVLPLPVEKRKEWRNGAERLQTLLFSGATWLELANHRCENRIPQTVSLVNP